MSLWLTVTHISALFLSLLIDEKQFIDNSFIIIIIVLSKSVTQLTVFLYVNRYVH